MEAQLLLSRSSYHAGTPVVGSVRIRYKQPQSSSCTTDPKSRITSARLYLAGRAHLGGRITKIQRDGGGTYYSNSKSKWRSTQEIALLKRMYGEEGHACLRMGVMNERESSRRRDAGSSGGGARGEDNKEVTYIEQAERFAVQSCLYPSSMHSINNNATSRDDGSAINNNRGINTMNDYSHLPKPQENDVICFWMTNVLELMDVPERHLECTCGFGMSRSSVRGIDIGESDGTTTTTTKRCQCKLSGWGRFDGDMNPFLPLQLPDLKVVKDVLDEKYREQHYDESDDSVQSYEDGEESLSSQDGCSGESSDTFGSESDRGSYLSESSATDSSVDHSIVENNQSVTEEEEEEEEATTSSSSAWDRIVASVKSKSNVTTTFESNAPVPLEQTQFALSFRVNLPIDVPPTMSAECVKYFYSAVLVVNTVDGEVSL